MYRVEKKDGRVLVYDLNDRLIYSAPESSYVVTKEDGKSPQVVQLKDRTEHQILMLLASAVKLPMDTESK